MFVTNNYPTSPVEVALAEFSLEVPIKSLLKSPLFSKNLFIERKNL